jgi:hypothetical protein
MMVGAEPGARAALEAAAVPLWAAAIAGAAAGVTAVVAVAVRGARKRPDGGRPP